MDKVVVYDVNALGNIDKLVVVVRLSLGIDLAGAAGHRG